MVLGLGFRVQPWTFADDQPDAMFENPVDPYHQVVCNVAVACNSSQCETAEGSMQDMNTHMYKALATYHNTANTVAPRARHSKGSAGVGKGTS